jgi:hypothetical protein
MASRVTVGVEEFDEGVCSQCFTLVGTHVGPLFEHRAIESLDLAVGLCAGGPCSSVLVLFAGCTSKCSTRIALSIVGELLCNDDIMGLGPREGTASTGARRLLLLAGQDLCLGGRLWSSTTE